jgi:hypothetical protein
LPCQPIQEQSKQAQMLENISWQQFFVFIGCMIAVYYIVLFFMLAKEKLKHNRQPPEKPPPNGGAGKRVWQVKDPAGEPAQPKYDESVYMDNMPPPESMEEEEGKEFDDLEELSAGIEQVLHEGEAGIEKQVLLTRLRSLISDYPQLKKLPFRVAINNVIIHRSRQQCNISISEAEAGQLWENR